MAQKGNGQPARFAVGLAALALLGAVTACGVDTGSTVAGPPEPGTVVVGSGDSIESEVVARIYAGALAAAGTRTELRTGIGNRGAYLAALDADTVSLVPDRTGRLLQHFDPDSAATEEEEVYEALNKSLPEGLSVSDYALADDRSTLVLAAGQAGRLSARSLEDLAPRCGELTLRASETFSQDVNGLSRLQSVYGCTFGQVLPGGPDAQVSADVLAGSALVGGITAGSPEIRPDDLTVLADDESAFMAQNVVPLFRTGTLGDAQVKALNVVAGELTTADLAELVGRIRDGKVSSADAAGEWLSDHI
ncbi:ABC transporter substrate-binding protein [Rhodococcus sp. ABRD24]|uniref:ABC transporter substrate-binding protein n=1 Tax=Rhodococcus sp. ABRD24 TaxID=2507582 RepID=UPI00103AFA39|nr:ABC transporter substrate-binding protein [Rhodococcus sp. ABRD24]QBJ97807.1 ABC transporter substrate-binding protein [Rhodococcus sp. ABRD24]